MGVSGSRFLAALLACALSAAAASAQSLAEPGRLIPPPTPPSQLERLPPVDSGVVQASHVELVAATNLNLNQNPEDRFGMLGLAFQEYVERQSNPPGFPKGKPSLLIGGQVQTDAVYFGQDEVSRESVGDLQDAADFRRARLVMQGISHEVYRYVFGVDFALAGRPSFLDMYIEHIDLPVLMNARVGQFFEPFSLERVTQNRNNTFMERSLVDTFAPARNLGAMTYGWNEAERATWQIGTFRTGSNDFGNDSFDSGQAFDIRGTCLPYYDEPSDGRYYVHLGACYSYRDTYQNQVRFRNSPEIRIEEPGAPNNFGPIFVDTGNIPASSFQLFDAEFAWINGPFSVQSEYAFTTVDQIGGPNLFFDGFMVQVSYFLTGEHRPYDRRMGIHQRMIPFSNFFRVRTREQGVAMGTGAWELAARFSMIRLNDQNIQGNNLQDFTFGVNWYWNPYIRTRFNYIRAFLDDPAFGKSATDIYGMRMDFEF
jgi:phosphate-selective porin OprO/OprP